MENNFFCSWLFFYSHSDRKSQSLDLLLNVLDDCKSRNELCSSLLYIKSGKNMQLKFPVNISGFSGIFQYLSNHKARIMEKLKDEEKEAFIAVLMNCDNFSMKHHVSIIKCLMMAYVCELAPLIRIRRAFVSMNLPNKIDQDDETYKNFQRSLTIWLNNAACKGIQRLLQKANKMFTESDVGRFINVSSLTSQLVYCMVYYAQTKMLQYSVKVPDVSDILKKEPPDESLAISHGNILLQAFTEICDNQDVFPIPSDKLHSNTIDNVQTTLAIALVFHWIFGNSLKTLENLLKKSSSNDISSNTSGKSQVRPTSIFINGNNQKLEESKTTKTFFMPTKPSAGYDGLVQIFSSKKAEKERNLLDKINNENKINSNGESSPEIFLTPTEEDIPATFSNSTFPTTKLLGQKSIPTNIKRDSLTNDEIPELMTISLKEEFQKKLQHKLNVQKTKVTIMPANETTWLAQMNKNEVNQIPLTPKKNNKFLQSLTPTDSQNLTKAQLNELQIQLGLRRQKIQNNKKKTAQLTEKNIEDSKKEVFFQALSKKPGIQRRSSLESGDFTHQNNEHNAEKRLSLLFTSPTKDGLFSEHSQIPKKNGKMETSNFDKILERNLEVEEYDENIKEIERPQSLQESDVALSPVQILHDQIPEVPEEINQLPVFPNNSSNLPDNSLPEEPVRSRKNSSASISSLSSASNKSSDKLLINQQEYYNSIEILNKSLSSLQAEIRILSQQQNSWSKQMISASQSKLLLSDGDSTDVNRNLPENVSVPETPTNKIISIPETVETPRVEERRSSTTEDEFANQISTSCPTIISIPIERPKDQNLHCFSPDDEIDGLSSTNEKSVVPRKLSNASGDFDRVVDKIEVNNNVALGDSFTNSVTDDETINTSSSTDSSIISNAKPMTFIISADQGIEDAKQRKEKILQQREEKRLLKKKLLKEKLEEERENRLSSTIDELMEREEKKRLEKEKRDSLLQKYLERKKSETSAASISSNNLCEKRSASTTNTPIKYNFNSKTLRPVASSGKQDSVGDLPLASLQKNNWFSSMRISNKKNSQSTSKLSDAESIINSSKFGVPLPPQEYTGPKLFGKRKVKTNRSVIVNAISHCCLAGSVNESLKESVLKELSEAEGTHFMILFRDARCQYRALYCFNLATDDLNLICGSGPKKISHDMVEKFYKYNSGAKQFNLIISTKHLSPAVDAIYIQSVYWSTPRPNSQIIPNPVSITTLNQMKSKKNKTDISATH